MERARDGGRADSGYGTAVAGQTEGSHPTERAIQSGMHTRYIPPDKVFVVWI